MAEDLAFEGLGKGTDTDPGTIEQSGSEQAGPEGGSERITSGQADETRGTIGLGERDETRRRGVKVNAR